MKILFTLCIAWSSITACSAATPPQWAINDIEFEEQAEAASQKLAKDGKLIDLQELFDSLPKKRTSLELPKAGVPSMAPPELAEYLRTATLAVGYTYYCKECDIWHVYLSSGFLMTVDGVICTSLHVFQDAEDGPEANFPIAVDIHGNVHPVLEMIAADVEADVCLIRIGNTANLTPLPLAESIRTGESIFLMSHPDSRYFRFSDGMVARIVFERRKNADIFTLIDVTAEFAPGSSGGPITDTKGNVVAIVSTIAAAPLAEDSSMDDGSAVSERLCVSSQVIAALALEGKNPRALPQSPQEQSP